MDMTQQIADGHGYLGYVVAAALLGSLARAAIARSRGEEFSAGAARLAGLLLALQFVYGIAVYVMGEYWSAEPLLAYLHPLAMLGGVALAGIATARAREAADAPGAWGAIVRFHAAAAVLVVVGVVAAVVATPGS